MSNTLADRFAPARAVADAVLYEGYVLYPYRASSKRNQARFQFGVLAPRAFSEADGSERWTMRTECLLDPGRAPLLSVRLRFLQVQHRRVEALLDGPSPAEERGRFGSVEMLEVAGQHYVAWDEALERAVDLAPFLVRSDECREVDQHFELEGGVDTELIRAADGSIAGQIVREREHVRGRILVATSPCTPEEDGRFVKVVVVVENTTSWSGASTRRDEVMGQSLVAVHTMLAIDGGSFISLLDPPDVAKPLVASCHSDGTFPVLIG